MRSLIHILTEYYASVMTTESKGIAQTSTNLTLLGLVEGEVEVVVNLFVLVILLVVDGGRNDVVNPHTS